MAKCGGELSREIVLHFDLLIMQVFCDVVDYEHLNVLICDPDTLNLDLQVSV